MTVPVRFVVPRLAFAAALAALLAATACSDHEHDSGAEPDHGDAGHDHAEEIASGPEPWAVTAWGELYEIFPEVDPLVAGEVAESHTHVTILADFSPLAAGEVAIVLRDAAGAEEVFRSTAAKRPGIFGIELRPARSGEYELLFRIDAAPGREEIAGGRVRVGDAAAPGGLLAAAPRTARAGEAAAAAGGEEIPFLKEQQWKTRFATAWVEEGELASTRTAPGRIVAAPGGDRTITAPADGVVRARPFPHVGLERRRGAPLFALTPRLDPERSLAALEAELAAAEAELALATTGARRARELAASGVGAIAERDEAEAHLAGAEARAEAARRDVATARRARGGEEGAGEALVLGAPFDGAVAEVAVSAGQAVEAGEVLGRFVATGAPWIEAWLAPEAAAGLRPGPLRVGLDTSGARPGAEHADLAARLVALSPALDAASGRRTALLELEAPLAAVAVGQSLDVEIATGEPLRGVVVPREAVVDDADVPVVYVQVSGETMLRREVEIVARAGDRCLVRGVAPGERLVVAGGTAVRRSALVSSGVGEAHVH
jgi:RND family efflux transporter MFP subunit